MRNICKYKSILIFSLCTLLCVCGVRAQTVSIGSGFTDTMLCVNAQFSVPITVTGSFAMANFFNVEMSNATGSFASPTVVGQFYGLVSGTAYCLLPSGITAGTGYRIRATATAPAYASTPFSKPIRVSNFPTVTAGTNGPLCVGDTVQLTSSSPNPQPTFSWTGPNGFTSNQQNPNIYNVPQAGGGKYLVYVTSYACSSFDSVTVVVSASPKILTFTNTSPVCEDDELTVSMTTNIPNAPANTFALTLPSNKVLNSAGLWIEHTLPKDGGWYHLKFSVGNCFDTASTFVTIKPRPDTPTATSNSPICIGETLQLNGSSTTNGVSYRWEGMNGFTGTGPSQSKANITKTDEGEYKVYAKKDGCESKAGTTQLKVGIPLVALKLSGDTMLCPGENLRLSAQTTNLDGIAWRKLGDTAVVSVLRTLNRLPVSAGDAGTYVVTQKELGCESPPSYITVTVPDLKEPKPEENGPLCTGETLKLTSVATDNGTYSWAGPNGFASNAQNPELKNVTEATEGKYFISSQLEYCTNTDSVTVIIKPVPEVTDISSNSPVCTFTELTLFAEANLPDSKFEWTGPDGFTSDQQNPKIDYNNELSGSYQVRIIKDGCISEYKSTDVESREGPGNSTAKNNGPINEGDELQLYANNDKEGVSFSWKGPEGFTSDEKNPSIAIATYRNSGEYELTSTYNTCTTITTTIVEIADILGITVDLYPNPNDGMFTIKGITQTDETLVLNIFNHQGMIVFRSNIYPDQSKFHETIDMSGASSGVYLLQLVSGREKRTMRFTIIRQ